MEEKCPKRVKNPCIICLQSVKKKNGVQCQGACNKWAHYTCLNFTPGKIKDIKAGIIKVVCPCPKCDTQGEPKEFMTEPHLLCDHQMCPANLTSKCGKSDCPLNSNDWLSTHPDLAKSNLPCGPNFCSTRALPPSHLPSYQKLVPYPQPYDSSRMPMYSPNPAQVSSHCRMPSNSQLQRLASQPQLVNGTTCMDPNSGLWSSSPTPVLTTSKSSNKTQIKAMSCSCFTSQEISSRNSSGNMYKENKKSDSLMKGKLRHSDSRLIFIRQEEQRKVLSAIQQLCKTVGNLSNEIKNLMTKVLNQPGESFAKL